MSFRTIRLLLGLLLAVFAATTAAAEPERVPQAILDLALEPPTIVTAPGPEYSDDLRDYAMVIGLDRTPRGRLWAAWVAGGDNDKGYFVAATSDDGGATWSKPRLVIDPPDVPPGPGLPDGLRRRILVGNFWTDPTGKLWLFFDQSLGYYDGRAGSWAITCTNPDDESPVWSAPRRIWHGASLNKPLVLKNGEWLMPISLWQRHHIRPASLQNEFHELDADRMAHLFVSTDQGATWTQRGGVSIPQTNFDEHMFVERRDGSLWMLARTNYGIAETTSTDGGRTWSEPRKSSIENVSARFFLRRLASGRLLLVKNGPLGERLKGRSQLTAFLSDDDGKSWQGGLVIDERDGVSYPDGFQGPDGVIHILHDRNRAADREILLAKFTEADVLAGRFITPGSQGKLLVNKARGGLGTANQKSPAH
jgi:predicted neuraminidase